MKKHGWWIITLALIAIVVGLLVMYAKKPGKYDTFAQCVNESGAKFYGAWWCPHCQDQKTMFGRSAQYLPYVECQTRSRQPLAACTDVDIKGFPTWIFADGTRATGKLSFEQLAEKTACELPAENK